MKAKIKILSYYISMIILSIMTLILSLITLLKYTVMNEEYLLKQLEKNNYYEKLHKSIKQEMSYYIIQSGLTDEVLNDIYSEEMIETEVKNIIINYYNNKELKVDTQKVSDNLNKNIQNYLLKNNIVADDQEALDRFVEEMVKIYDQEIKISNAIEKTQDKFIQLDNLIDKLFIILIITIPLLGIILHIFYKRIIFTIPTISTSILLFLGTYLFFHRIDVKNILFWNENVSEIIKSVLWSIKDYITKEAIILLIIGVIAFVLGYYLTNKNKKEIIKENVKKEVKIKGVKKKMNKEKFNTKIKNIQKTLKKHTNKLTDKIKNLKKKEKTVENVKPKDPNEIEELFGYVYGTTTTAEEAEEIKTPIKNKQKSKKKKRKRR